MRSRAAVALVAMTLGLAGCGIADARKAAIADAAVTPVDMASALRPGLVGMPDYPATGWEPSGASPMDASAASLLAKIGLTKADLGSKLTVKTVADGTSLGIPTLDFCNANYPSEKLRVLRLQRAAYDSGGAYSGLSTEVVVYQSVKAAQQALRELVAARVSCKEDTPFTTPDGHVISLRFHTAPGPADTPLVGANARLIVHVTMQVDGSPETAFLVYQFDGRVLAALYALDSSGKPFPQSALDAFFGLAGDLAQRLQQYAPKLASAPRA